MDSNYRQRSGSSASDRRRSRASDQRVDRREGARNEKQQEPGAAESRKRRSQPESQASALGRRPASSSQSRNSNNSSSRRSTSSQTRQRQSDSARSSSQRRDAAADTRRSTRRQMVEYDQIATNDLQHREQSRDPYLRSARRIRESDSTRALSESSGNRTQSRSGRRYSSDSAPQSSAQSGERRSSEVTGRTVRNQRKQHAARPKQALRRSRIIAGLVSTIILTVVAVIVYFSPAFQIKSVEVLGGWHLNSSHLTELAQIPANTTLLRLDTRDVAERVALDPWVAEVKISREFPSTLTVSIVERQPAAMVVLAGADTTTGRGVWILASDGVWLGEVISIDQDTHGIESSQLVRIIDVPDTLLPVAGQTAEDPSITNALAIAVGISTPMKAMVDYISAPSVVQTTLYLSNNVEVVFGSADDVSAKEAVINQLIAEYGPGLQRINVRVVNRPTIRTTSTPNSD